LYSIQFTINNTLFDYHLDYLDSIERVYVTARTMQIEHGAKADSLMPEIYEMVNFIFMQELEERYTEEF